jgi:RNA polymerase sigma factor (TIGR02999 family)
LPEENLPITTALQDFARGDKTALSRLIPLLYTELKKLADGYMRGESKDHTLQPTALVNELYIRLMRQQAPEYQSRAHFIALAAQVMRQILVDHARTRNAAKRGGGAVNFALNDALDQPVESPVELIRVDEALQLLEKQDPVKARLVEMRFFGGLTAEESADVLQMPVSRVRKDVRIALAWMESEIEGTN